MTLRIGNRLVGSVARPRLKPPSYMGVQRYEPLIIRSGDCHFQRPSDNFATLPPKERMRIHESYRARRLKRQTASVLDAVRLALSHSRLESVRQGQQIAGNKHIGIAPPRVWSPRRLRKSFIRCKCIIFARRPRSPWWQEGWIRHPAPAWCGRPGTLYSRSARRLTMIPLGSPDSLHRRATRRPFSRDRNFDAPPSCQQR
jgi:hypothetical protein